MFNFLKRKLKSLGKSLVLSDSEKVKLVNADTYKAEAEELAWANKQLHNQIQNLQNKLEYHKTERELQLLEGF
ncbi:MAG: hypothetical protein R6U96_14650 [Promethearchaeia archaeon]